jgi:hypothetical protein
MREDGLDLTGSGKDQWRALAKPVIAELLDQLKDCHLEIFCSVESDD